MKRILILTLTVLCLFSFLSLPAVASSDLVFDNGEMLTPEEELALQEQADFLTREVGCAFYVVTHRMTSAYDTYWGEHFLADQGLSDTTGLILLMVTLDQGVYYYDLYTYGVAYRKISDHELSYILDDPAVYENIKSGNVAEGATACLELSREAYEGNVGSFYVMVWILSFLIALAIAIGICYTVYRSYTTKKRSVDYPLDRFAKLELTHQEDVFAGSFVTKRYIQTNNGSSGHSGGGGRGGGGGHRGGR